MYFLQKKTMNLKSKIIYILLSTVILLTSYTLADSSLRGLKGYEENVIDATKNARLHSNMGNIYFDEKNYTAALKEYQIAYNLNPNDPSSSVYLYNIARCFINLGAPSIAITPLKGAINKNYTNLIYYETLADCFVKTNTAKKELKNYLKNTKNPYNKIMAGFIYLKMGDKITARTIFDDFINEYPKMIVVQDIKTLIKKL